MRFLGMGIGHQDGITNASISDDNDMDCDPDACEESEECGDNEARQGAHEDIDEEDTEEEEEEEENTEDEGEEGREDDSEDDVGYGDL